MLGFKVTWSNSSVWLYRQLDRELSFGCKSWLFLIIENIVKSIKQDPDPDAISA